MLSVVLPYFVAFYTEEVSKKKIIIEHCQNVEEEIPNYLDFTDFFIFNKKALVATRVMKNLLVKPQKFENIFSAMSFKFISLFKLFKL